MGWTEFAAAFSVFFLSHSLPVRPPLRPMLQAALGPQGFTLAYSVLSLAVLAWLIGAAGRAPYVALWDWAPWQVYVPLLTMLPVCLILTLAIARPNPFSFGGAQNGQFDPARPGIVRLYRHPLLLALALWAAAHAVPNGDLAHVMLFGTFTVFAVLGMRLIDSRRQREMGSAWHTTRAAVASVPIERSVTSVPRFMIGIALYAALIWLHPHLFGVSPLP